MNEILPWILSLGSGAIGGNLAGAVLKNFSLGKIGNSLAGILGGGLGAKLLAMLGIAGAAGAAGASTSGGLDLSSILANLGGGAAGGGLLVSVIGMVKQMMGGK